ncbi:hypothetical protein [Streptomyces californicus]|uniref:hypothetical protein n=1 Tax=Streptomyces californicus TaxID=67351 RepID=UPI00371B84B0
MASTVELKHSEVQALADRVGSLLGAALNGRGTEGGGWIHQVDAEAHYLSFSLVHPRGLVLSLRHHNTHLKGSAGRRLTVECVYPRGYSGAAETTTVGLDSSISSMVSRIVSHLLPDYVRNLEVARAERRAAQEHRRARQLMNREMEQPFRLCTPPGGKASTRSPPATGPSGTPPPSKTPIRRLTRAARSG